MHIKLKAAIDQAKLEGSQAKSTKSHIDRNRWARRVMRMEMSASDAAKLKAAENTLHAQATRKYNLAGLEKFIKTEAKAVNELRIETNSLLKTQSGSSTGKLVEGGYRGAGTSALGTELGTELGTALKNLEAGKVEALNTLKGRQTASPSGGVATEITAAEGLPRRGGGGGGGKFGAAELEGFGSKSSIKTAGGGNFKEIKSGNQSVGNAANFLLTLVSIAYNKYKEREREKEIAEWQFDYDQRGRPSINTISISEQYLPPGQRFLNWLDFKLQDMWDADKQKFEMFKLTINYAMDRLLK